MSNFFFKPSLKGKDTRFAKKLLNQPRGFLEKSKNGRFCHGLGCAKDL
jgi:hypothetical protein